MAGVAEVESGGNPQAYNPSGASGLWQIEIPVNARFVPGGAGNVFNALDNAKAAVALSGNTLAGIQSNWLAFEPPGAAEAIAAKNGGTVPSTVGATGSSTRLLGGTTAGVSEASVANGSTGSGSTGSTGSGSTGSTGTVPDPAAGAGVMDSFASGLPIVGNLFKALEPIFHAVATVIDYSFAMFEPGQGPRALFAAGAAVLAFLSYKILASAGVVPDIHLPKAVPV